MTAADFVRAECANHQSDSSCLGVWIGDDLAITRCDPKPRCHVLDGHACPYLEKVVLPMAGQVRDARRAAELQQAVSAYHRAVEADQTSHANGQPIARM